MEDIKTQARQIELSSDKVISKLQKKLKHNNAPDRSDIGKKLKRTNAEILELEQKISRLYEDKVSGNVSEQTFAMLIRNYEKERNIAKEN